MNQVLFCRVIPGKNNLKLHTPQVLCFIAQRGTQNVSDMWVTGDAVQVYMEMEMSGYGAGPETWFIQVSLTPYFRIHLVCSDHLAFYKIPLLSLFLSLLEGQQRPGCHPTLPPCSSDSSLLHLLAPTPIPPSGLPLPITYLSLGCLGVGAPIVNLNL